MAKAAGYEDRQVGDSALAVAELLRNRAIEYMTMRGLKLPGFASATWQASFKDLELLLRQIHTELESGSARNLYLTLFVCGRLVFDVEWTDATDIRIVMFSRGAWEKTLSGAPEAASCVGPSDRLSAAESGS